MRSHRHNCQMHCDRSLHSHCHHDRNGNHNKSHHHNRLQSHRHLGCCTHQSQSWAYKRKGTIKNGGKYLGGLTIPSSSSQQGVGIIILHQGYTGQQFVVKINSTTFKP